MKYEVTRFDVEVRFKDGRIEKINAVDLCNAIQRQVSISLYEKLVSVLPLEPATRWVIECDFCGYIEPDDVTEESPALGDEGEGPTMFDHVCKSCREEYAYMFKEAA